MTRAGHLLAGLLGMFFVGIGVAKLGGQFGLEDYLAMGWPFWVHPLTGTAQLFGGLALLWPRTRRGGALTLLGVIALLCWQPATHAYGPTAGGALLCAALSGILVTTLPLAADQG
jgi:hypothetical protein